ncbi:uncharacterized protein LOC107044476 [Diachasma alloeum]|uniref:uncharacterized protein LOC107044476 n=1 Tax=Diachasma alloeum TaxID=454923 RepID=UPI0007384AE3|nr:uncharacterized protein LOC107044476 [Diachasma alloeum]
MGSLYFKPSLDLDYVLEMLQVSLDETFSKFPDDILILDGDVNATVAEFEDDLSPEEVQGTTLFENRNYLVKDTDARGEFLMDFMPENGFILLNGRAPSDSPARFTSSKSPSAYDMIWVNHDKSQWVEDMWVSSDLLGSNHLPVSVKLRISNEAAGDLDLSPKPQTPTSPSESATARVASLVWQPSREEDFVTAIGSPSSPLEASSRDYIEATSTTLTEAIRIAALECGMSKVMAKPRHSPPVIDRKNPWFDRDCARKKKKVHNLFRNVYKPVFNKPAANDFDCNMKNYKKLIESKKAAYEKELADRFFDLRNPIAFWSAVASVKDRPERNEGINLVRWNEFLQNMYPPRSEYLFSLLDTTDSDLDSDISMLELSRSIKHARPGKAPGEDMITNSFLNALPADWMVFMLDLFNVVYRLGVVPNSWTSMVLCMIHKKGDVSDPLNYRGIALVNNITKVFTSILNDRLYAWAEAHHVIPEEQAGFRQRRGAMDNITTLQMTLHNKLRLAGGKVYGLFVDFRRAFKSLTAFSGRGC